MERKKRSALRLNRKSSFIFNQIENMKKKNGNKIHKLIEKKNKEKF